ncbi:hypothetical protein DVR12_26125 [Chitinophaga silvatica]|uniref:ZU5 domain-containing protein n=1 Tax=Chitinophaga silvatica TaxID=2282649 RepID=A0A3E1Y2D9_9BACT|nr:hypothetical protein [Chitinophaga silvatica]RFS18860.1 hypothetical protein DVR12_26125 [Chitinophaga silvatica]
MNTNKLVQLFFIAGLIILGAACKKSNTDKPDNSKPSVPLKTPRGQVVGTPKKVTIGANGGSIAMPDNYISIQVPAGAVDNNTEFSIQEVQANAGIQTGRLFRILPEGITLKKPVEITFHYTDTDIEGSNEDYLYPCYQNSEGGWHKIMDCTLDKSQKTLKVSTTHFSDWALLRDVAIKTTKNALGSGEEATLEAYVIDEDEDGTIPEFIGLKPEQIVEWKVVVGGGTISGGKNPIVTYKAPNTSAQVEAMVEVTVKNVVKKSDPKRPGNGGLVIVRRTITVLPEEYVVWKISGGEQKAMFFSMGVFNGKAILSATATNESVSFQTNSYVIGKFSVGDMSKPKMADLTATYEHKTYESKYTECDTYNKVYASGSIIYDMVSDTVGGLVQGSFEGQLFKLENCVLDYRNVSGRFRVRRGQ